MPELSITPNERDAMLARMIEQLPPELSCWRDAAAVHASWATVLDEQLDWCTNESFAELRARRIGVATSRDYLQRILDVNGHRILCGIRFYNLDPNRAFVELIAWTCPAIDFAAGALAAMEAHSVFKPQAVRIFQSGLTAPQLADGWQSNGDDVLCAETLETIISAPPPPNDDRVTLADADDVDEAVAFVATGYKALAERSPQIAQHIEPEGRDELAECQEDGRLAWWQLDGETAGLIAVRREQWLGLDGYLIVEEVVAPEFVGLRTASAAQRRMAESLAAEGPGRVLFGTIDFCNIPSRRTAARAGRREIAAWWFIHS